MQEREERKGNKRNSKYYKTGLTGICIVAVGLLCFLLIINISNIMAGIQWILAILMPFLYGAVIAYLLAPACNRLEQGFLYLFGRKGKKQKDKLASALSIIVSILAVILILWVLLLMIIPQVCRSVIGIVNTLPGQLDMVNQWLHDLFESQPELLVYWDSLSVTAVDKLNDWMKTDLLPTAQSLLTGLGSQIAGVVSVFKNLFLGIIVSVYLLMSRKKFAAQAEMVLRGVFPHKWAELIDEEVHYADRMFSGFFVGKLLDSAIIGGICFLFTLIVGMESSVLISVVVGVTNIIPFFGPYIGAIPCIILLLLENPLHCLYFTIFIIILQQLDGNFIGPKILGSSTGLSGFWVLFSILLFGGMWGFFGMIVGVPFFAVIYDIFRKVVFYLLNRRGNQKMILDYEERFGEAREEEPAEE